MGTRFTTSDVEWYKQFTYCSTRSLGGLRNSSVQSVLVSEMRSEWFVKIWTVSLFWTKPGNLSLLWAHNEWPSLLIFAWIDLRDFKVLTGPRIWMRPFVFLSKLLIGFMFSLISLVFLKGYGTHVLLSLMRIFRRIVVLVQRNVLFLARH